MTEWQDDIFQFTQKGFCKFKQNGQKRHENQICKDLEECRNKKCQERLPQICKYLIKYERCRNIEKSSYLHRKQLHAQDKLNEIMAFSLTTQIREMTNLKKK